MKSQKYPPILIHNLNIELISKLCSYLSIKSLKNLSKSSSYISRHLNSDLNFWQSACKLNLPTVLECKNVLKTKYKLFRNIKSGSNESSYTFITHQKDITYLKIHDKYVYTSSDDTTMKQFSFSGVLINTFLGHKGGIWSFSVDKVLVTGSTDKTAIIWDMASGIPLHKLKGHTNTVRVVKTYGDYVCTGGRDCFIRIWNLIGECLFILSGHTSSVRCLDINRDFLLSGSYDGSVVLWDYKKGKRCFNLVSHKSRVYSVLLGKKYIISGGLDAFVHISTFDNKLVTRYKCHDILVISLSFSHAERYLVSSAADNILVKWDVLDNKKEYTINEKCLITSHFIYEELLFLTTINELQVYDYETGLFIRTVMKADKFIKVEMYEDKLIVAYLLQKNYHIKIYTYTNNS
ncbi:F-box/WD40 repeat domain-containing protein 7 [Vairimorpha necatrix]|uniref:F-box/WD40 repeat domain-containing protein 7 n=1 Tax=Vairimorpha necatrix TaxID=6039 RepID=A0AAX4JA09_9MICR